MSDLIPTERIESKILVIRNQKILLDSDLAELYGVETGQLKRQVRRNMDRFPEDFMFELNKEEYNFLRCQTGILKQGGHSKYLPFAFSEQGVAMLSTVLNSKRAILVNIAIMRAFVKMREMMLKDQQMSARMDEFEDRLGSQEFQTLALIDQLGSMKKKLNPSKSKMPKIGFKH